MQVSIRGGFTMGSLGSGEPSDFWEKFAQFFLKKKIKKIFQVDDIYNLRGV